MSEPRSEHELHDHEWQDTGFATVEECAMEGCRLLRSGGVEMDPADFGRQPLVGCTCDWQREGDGHREDCPVVATPSGRGPDA